LLAAATAGAAGKAHHGYVYTLTNSAAGNAVAVFARADDGSLAPAGTVATGGLGTGANLGSQGSIIVSGHKLFAVNAGSNTISYFRLRHDGLQLQGTIPSGGVQPTSLTVHDHVLYVLNAGGSGNITGFTVGHDGLAPLAGSTRPLGAGSSGPAQVSFSPNGKTLVVTEKASSTIDTYAIGADGRASAPVSSPSAGATPFGFDFDNRGHLLVSEAAGSASSYAVSGAGASVISGAVATHQGAPCWLVTSKNGRYAYTANAAAGSISGFSVGQDGSLSLLDASGVTASLGATSHPLDEAVSNDGRFLYNLTDGLHTISAFRIAADGSLTFVGNAPVPVGAVGLAVQ
jgi:6-phosphogluconolactonase (cycloisomerase 2 family)